LVVAAVEPKRPPEEVLAGAPNKFVVGVPPAFVLPPAGAPKLKAIFTLQKSWPPERSERRNAI